MKDAVMSWGASAILAPILLGILGVFWATYNDVMEIKASEVAREHRMESLEQSYQSDVVEIKAKVDKVYDILIDAEQFRKAKAR